VSRPDDDPASSEPSSDFLSTVVRTAAEGICVCAPCAEFPFVSFTVWNDRMTELTGYTMAEINRLGWYQSVYPDPAVRERAIERMARMRAGDDLRQEEWTITRKDGTERLLAMSTSRVRIDGHESVVALMTDVTERKRAEEDLRRIKDRLAIAQRVARMGSWEWDIRSGAVWWSAEMYRIFGQDPATFRPTLDEFMALVHPDDRPVVREHVDRTLTGGAPYQYECRIVRADGAVRWKRAEGVLELDPSGAPSRLLGTGQDVTEERHATEARRALEEHLREARRFEALGVLAGGMAHEFNNILTAVLGHADLADVELPADSPVRQHIGPIRDGALRAAERCRQMLAYAGKGRLRADQIDLEEVAREAAGSLAPQARVEWVAAPARPMVFGDAEQLRQLVANLLLNTAEADPAGAACVSFERKTLDANATARLRLTRGLPAGDYVVLEVRDQGPGMDDATLARAFEPFFSTKFPGRGLGLPVVLGVVRAHRGGLEVDTRPGGGTTVRVYLPPGEQ
jgi:PAS domain S-box-containing protein